MTLFGGKPLAASGESVTAIVLDSAVVLKVGDNREHEFRIETDFRISLASEDLKVHFNPYGHDSAPPCHLSKLATIVGHSLDDASAFTDGVLVLSFDDGPVRSLRVEPLDRYEAWTYTFGNYILSCPPGGRLA